MSSHERADNLMVLFMLGWALLIVAAFVKAVYSCIRKMCYGDEGRRVSNEDEDASAEIYRSMSPGRQEEIDNLRKNALRRYLRRFTLTLDDEHMLCCAGSQTDTDTLSPSKNEVHDESIALDANSKDNVERHGDIEEGHKDFEEDRDDMAQDCNSTAVEYTHISLPLPGCDANGINLLCSMVADMNRVRQADGEATATGPTTNVKKKWKLTSLFRNEDSCPCEDGAIEEKTEQVAKRTVPIFCAICLTEYVKCDRVCWSSNAECSHVFHEDCILQWLISLGKKKSMSQLLTQHPTDEKLLQYKFCPCCRQDFISVKPALSVSEESV